MPQGKSYIIQCDSDGNMFLMEGRTGRIINHAYLWANIEASPAVFGNMVVVGTRRRKILRCADQLKRFCRLIQSLDLFFCLRLTYMHSIYTGHRLQASACSRCWRYAAPKAAG